MAGFEKVHFRGTFRNYQQRVLDNSHKYLADGRIHIVAAPGSGKTVLGLELIRRLNAPCIILSPTTAIRQQWGARFKDLFLDDPADFDALFSGDLHHIRLLNSVTYQALYTAVEKVAESEEEDADCSDVDIFAAMKAYGIRTVCLDEAHHLKNEWQKSLEKFLAALDPSVRIISLTATPPYDSEGTEWKRYQAICGEIDEEIFVPELVGQKTLCPHQDYVYFNFPTESERETLTGYKESVAKALEELQKLPVFGMVSQMLNAEQDYEKLFAHVKEHVALLMLLQDFGYPVQERLIRQLTTKKTLPKITTAQAETALQFLLDGDMLTKLQKEKILEVVRANGVFHKRKVVLSLDEKLKRQLISSVGKLDSIAAIAKSEIAAMGQDLRMLVLTDYIKKESLSKAVTAEEFSSVNVVSIFETLRRISGGMKIGVLSGTLVILPASIDLSAVKHSSKEIPGTEYVEVSFPGAVHRAVDFVGKLFEAGQLQILVGTKSLLGEGWDSPCINSLILASFVGSVVLSNQMRGRAIRIDKNHPEKISNIWHLVTVEPAYIYQDKALSRQLGKTLYDKNQLVSCDFDVLKRRFDAFMGPNYTTGVVESGIERITAIQPPYDEAGIAAINQKMLELSRKRETVAASWQGEVADGHFNVTVQTQVPQERRVPVPIFSNFMLAAALAAVQPVLMGTLARAVPRGNVLLALLTMAVGVVTMILLGKVIKTLICHLSPARSVAALGRAVYRTMVQCDLISPAAKVEAFENKDKTVVALQLRNATIHDQNVFNTAMAEMLSPIENPRYLLIGRNMFGGYKYSLSYACPSAIGRKKEYVEVLAKKLKGVAGKFEPVYCHREEGRKLILKCRRHSYITANQQALDKKYRVSHLE